MFHAQRMKTLWGENRGKVLSLLLLALLLAAMQLWQGFWIAPSLKTTRGQLRNIQSNLHLEQQRVAAGGGARISGVTDDLARFYQRIPARSGLGNFIGRLYSYAAESGIDIAQISYVAKPLKGTRLLGYQLRFAVSGSYVQVKKFIHQLENSPSLLILQKIALDETRQKEKEVVNLQMQLQTFFREGE